MKKYLVAGFICALLFGSASAFATTVTTVIAYDDIYNPTGFIGTIPDGATGSAATINFLSPVFGDVFTINFTNASGIVQSTLYSDAQYNELAAFEGDSIEFDGLLSGNSVIGSTCVASSNTACVLFDGSPIELSGIIQGLTGDGIFEGGQIFVQNGVPSVPEPSSLMLLGTGIVGAVGAARRRFNRAA